VEKEVEMLSGCSSSRVVGVGSGGYEDCSSDVEQVLVVSTVVEMLVLVMGTRGQSPSFHKN